MGPEMGKHLKPPPKQYPLNQCALFKLRTKRRLATVLHRSQKHLQKLANGANNYRIWTETDSCGKARRIEHPTPPVFAVHVRVADLLRRVSPPDYLFSAPGRSAIDNARQHLAPLPTLTLDIKGFFSNASKTRVRRAFADWLQCSPDVAEILTRICVCSGHIPTGSPLSAELAFWAYRDMFDEIHEYVTRRGGTFTLYIDDMTATLPGGNRADIRRIGRIVDRAGLRWHKSHFYPKSTPKAITGVVVRDGRLRVPNKLHQKMLEEYRELANSNEAITQSSAADRLRGRLDHSAQIDARMEPRRQGAHGLARGLTRKALNPSRRP